MNLKAKIFQLPSGDWRGCIYDGDTLRAYCTESTWRKAVQRTEQQWKDVSRLTPWQPSIVGPNPFCHPTDTGKKKGPGPFGKHCQGPPSWDGLYDPTEI